ncbi:MAG TPA: tripartite tricarboxylate transporter substrate binding protein [Burkholderiales bacterium]|jgi:tripartite-type tricarboxylate transporter receptor subunit TctC
MNLAQRNDVRRKFLAAAALALAMISSCAFAQPNGAKPITIVVPFPPGSTADLLPRMVAPYLTQAMGMPVIVENKPGASGSIGAAYVARAEPNGRTLLVTPTVILAVNQWLYKDLGYNPDKDFAPITNAAATPNVWVAQPAFAAKSLAEVVSLSRSQRGGLSFASGGNGTSHHLCGELLRKATGANLVHVPYKGPAPALQDVLAGQVPLICDNLSNVLPHIRAGRLRPLAVTAAARHPALPDVPTTAEAGFPGADLGVWYGFVAPAGTPKALIERLNGELARALHAPQVASKLEGLGLTIVANSPEEFGRFIAAEATRMRALVQASGAAAD